MSKRLLVFVLIVLFEFANVKPQYIDKNTLYKSEIEVEVISDEGTFVYKTKLGTKIYDFLKENNLKSSSELNETYVLADHDVINLKSNNRISINLITLEELENIPYISSKNASDIIDYRNTYGQFKTIEEVGNIKGIGEAKLNILKEYLTI